MATGREGETPAETFTCPDCGSQSRDPEWCDTCGAPLAGQPNEAVKWLEVGDVAEFESTEQSWKASVKEIVENYATRRVVVGTIEASDSSREGELVVIEERETFGGSLPEVPEGVRHLFREPFALGSHGEHPLRVYQDTPGMTIEDLVDVSNGQLTFAQVKDTFLAVLDLVIESHREEQLILAVAPWTVRVEGGALSARASRSAYEPIEDELETADVSRGDLPEMGAEKRREDVTLEEPLAAVLAAGKKQIDDERKAGASTRDAEGEADVETVEGSDAAHTREMTPDEVDDAVAEIDADSDVEELMGVLDSQDSLDADSEALSQAVEIIEDGDMADWEMFDDDDVDDIDDEELLDVLGDTGILDIDQLVDEEEPARAVLEGLDRLYPFGETPEEVPVVMGFSPPELLGRVRAELAPWCDVFSLGMLLYYMISGHVPPASVYTRYTPALPMRNFRPGFPPGLQPVVSRATRPSPDDRYASVESLRDAFLNACELMERRSAHIGSSNPPRVHIAVDTHVGIAKGKRNPTNQDSVFGRVSDDGQFSLIVVADGVSTANYGSGDLASRFLKAAAEEIWEDVLPTYLMDERIDEIAIIRDILNQANDGIVAYVNEHHTPFMGNPHEVMGSTALVAIIRDGVVTLAALGDSRAYIQNASGLEQTTIDHNLWTLSILDGVAPDSALAMPHGDALARCLGTFMIDDGDLDPVNPEPDFFRFSLSRGDSLLLTTDGLVDFAGANPFAAEENILAVMLAEPDPALACLELILLANRGGGGDNIGVGIAQFI